MLGRGPASAHAPMMFQQAQYWSRTFAWPAVEPRC